MLFNSQVFIFLFLPLALLGWYGINRLKLHKLALVFLVGMSLWFYGYFNYSYLLIILASMAGNYFLSFLMERFKSEKALPVLRVIGILFNIGILGYYKYYDFFLETVNAVFGADFTLKHVLLPLGISFFTLQQLSFIIDRSWGTAPHYGIVEYLAYVTFFPQLIAGPIVLHDELIPQFRDESLRKFNLSNFVDGIIIFNLGLIKKVLLADNLALLVNAGYSKTAWLDMPSAWLLALTYTFELYFDFSGYCDMAVGIGRMFNFKLPGNFNSPYKSHSASEYWQRWHFTLTRFLQTYLYNPIALKGMRSKNKKVKKAVKIITPMIVFLVSGFWHGASWTFVLWGVLEGLAVVWSQRKKWKLKKGFISWLGTFIFTVFAAAIFRSERWGVMVAMLKGMFRPKLSLMAVELTGAYKEMAENYIWVKAIETVNANWLNVACPIFALILMTISTLVLMGKNSTEILASQREKGFTKSFTIALVLLTGWALISLTQVSTFLYFNF